MIDAQKQVKPVNRKTQLIIVGLVLFGIAGSVCLFAVKALCDPGVAFLATDKRADWILYYLSPETGTRNGSFLELTTEFTKDFDVNTIPGRVELYVKGFEKYQLWVNGGELSVDSKVGKNWKKARIYEISSFLKQGSNEIKIRVDRKYGPPCLWLYSDGLDKNIKTDNTWMASIKGSPAVAARVANDCLVHRICLAGVRPVRGFIKKFPQLIVFFLASFGIFWLYYHKQKSSTLKKHPVLRFLTFTPKSVLIISIIVWTIVFINNVAKIPVKVGFDAEGHLQYVKYIIEHQSFPLASHGYEMHSPPLYYLGSAIILGFGKVFLEEGSALYWLKIIPFFCGIGHIFLAYFAARILFVNDKSKQALAVAMAAMIPMNIYMSHYVSNELLCGFMLGLLVLVAVIILNSKKVSLKSFCVFGILIGFAFLTKYTVLTIMPVICVMLLYKLFFEEKYSLVNIAGYFGLMFVIVIAIAGWYYVRNWVHFGNPMVLNWDTALGFGFWQDPGFHTSKFFCQFGKVFSSPYFAGFYSFFDSLYSTFWGDAFLGGRASYAYRPPWNYEYMSAVYFLAIPATLLIIAGLIRATTKVIFGADKLWLLILGSVFAMGYSIIYMNLSMPIYGFPKAFLGLLAVWPLSLMFALGFDYLDKWLRNKKLLFVRAIFYGWFGTLTLAILFSFFVRPAQMRTPPKLSVLARQGRLNQAFGHYKQLLEDNPDNFDAHYWIANIYSLDGKYGKAIEHYQRAYDIVPEWPDLLNNFAATLVNKPNATRTDKAGAVHYARRACELTGYLEIDLLNTLADAYAFATQFNKAIEITERAAGLAADADNKSLLHNIQRKLQFYKSTVSNSSGTTIPLEDNSISR